MDSSSTSSSSTGHIRVYLVDDHPPIRDAAASTLADAIDVALCGQAARAGEALAELDALAPDVIVVDISLEDGHGIDLVRLIRDQWPDTGVLVYSMHDESVYAERALRAGASGYLTKTEPPTRLVTAIRTVNRGEVYLSRAMRSEVLGHTGSTGATDPHFAIDELTEREREVFRLLGQGHSVEEIQEQLDLSRKTVETYRRRAKEKLGLDSVTALLQYAVQWAYVADVDDSGAG